MGNVFMRFYETYELTYDTAVQIKFDVASNFPCILVLSENIKNINSFQDGSNLWRMCSEECDLVLFNLDVYVQSSARYSNKE